MSAKRIRRFTLTLDGNAIEGCRNFEFDPGIELNQDGSDDEENGEPVRTGVKPSGTFDMQAGSANAATGYYQTAVVTYKEVEIQAANEVIVSKTITFSKCYLTKSVSAPTEGVGKCGMKLVAKSYVEA